MDDKHEELDLRQLSLGGRAADQHNRDDTEEVEAVSPDASVSLEGRAADHHNRKDIEEVEAGNPDASVTGKAASVVHRDDNLARRLSVGPLSSHQSATVTEEPHQYTPAERAQRRAARITSVFDNLPDLAPEVSEFLTECEAALPQVLPHDHSLLSSPFRSVESFLDLAPEIIHAIRGHCKFISQDRQPGPVSAARVAVYCSLQEAMSATWVAVYYTLQEAMARDIGWNVRGFNELKACFSLSSLSPQYDGTMDVSWVNKPRHLLRFARQVLRYVQILDQAKAAVLEVYPEWHDAVENIGEED
jgi:hypothetical protein